MFHNFTGNSRRPRQVNLSGRNSNPFATYGQSQNPVATAQQDREARRRERERTQAVTTLQKSWRGYASRKHIKEAARARWDENEEKSLEFGDNDGHSTSYCDEETAYNQLDSLLRFLDVRQDLPRLEHHFYRLMRSIQESRMACSDGPWPKAYLRLQTTCLLGLDELQSDCACDRLVEIIQFTNSHTPRAVTVNAAKYYETFRKYSLRHTKVIPLDILEAPMRPATLEAYQMFAHHILTLPELSHILGGEKNLTRLADNINCKLLANAVALLIYPDVLRESQSPTQDQSQMWLLGQVIYFHRCAYGFDHPERYASQPDFVFVVATLLSRLADRVDFEGKANSSKTTLDEENTPPSFLLQQVGALVNQASIGGLVCQMSITDSNQANEHSRLMAGYILTLLRLFSRRSDEIRMWLYLGSSNNLRPSGYAAPFFQLWSSIKNTDESTQ